MKWNYINDRNYIYIDIYNIYDRWLDDRSREMIIIFDLKICGISNNFEW